MSSKTILIGLSIFRCGSEIKGPCMEDLLGSWPLMTVIQSGLKISPRGAEMCQWNALLMSKLESTE